MRTLTATETTRLQSRSRAHHARLLVYSAAGAWQDFTTLGGRNWLVGVPLLRQGADEPVARLQALLRRDHGELSLSPFRGDSSLNVGGAAIDAGRAVRLETATVPWRTDPVEADWRRVFEGVIDRVEFPHSTMSVYARDPAGALVDAWVETPTVYGTVAGRALHLVIQDVLDDWAPGTTLVVPTAPLQLVPEYEQQQMSVWDAVRALAGTIGWDVRFEWSDADGAFRLHLLQPDRAITNPHWTLAASHYHDVVQLSVDREFVRNVVVVRYLDRTTGLEATETATDATSVARFGRRWMELVEGPESPIGSAAEAAALAAAAIADLAWPVADKAVELPYFWPVQTGDLLRFSANDVHTDTDMDLAVVAYQHELLPTQGRERTTLTLRGKPVGFYQDWLRRGRTGALEEPTALQMQYAVDDAGTGASDTFNPATHFYARHSTDGGGTWTAWYRIVGEDGVAQDGPYKDFRFAAAATQPATPVGEDPAGWTDAPPTPGVGELLWMSSVWRNGDGTIMAGQLWTTPVQITGPAGEDGEDGEDGDDAPVVEIDSAENGMTGTRWVKIYAGTVAVTNVQVVVQVGITAPSAATTPLRDAGDASVVRGGTLGAGEYEHDVPLDNYRGAWIVFLLTLATGEVMAVSGPNFDQGRTPDFATRPRVESPLVFVDGDSDTVSMSLERTSGGTWKRYIDSWSGVFDVTVADHNSNAGQGTGTSYPYLVTLYSDPVANIDGSTLTSTHSLWVTIGSPSPPAAVWDAVALAGPSASSDVVTITLDASAAPAGSYVVLRTRAQVGGEPWTAWSTFTGSVSPALSTPPTSATAYTYATGYTRVAKTASTPIVSVDVEARLYDTSDVLMDTETVSAQWYIAEPV